MRISAIVALSDNNVIGNNGKLPWSLPSDLKRFRSITSGHIVIMGRKTFESIGRPLPNRKNIIISRTRSGYDNGNYIVVESIEKAIETAISIKDGGTKDGGAKDDGTKETEIFIIGGAEIYKQTLHLVDRIYLTRIHTSMEGDTIFPSLNLHEWVSIREELHVEDGYKYTFSILERVRDMDKNQK